LSTQITRCPCESRCSHKWEPRKPAPPVTTVVVTAREDTRGVGLHTMLYEGFTRKSAC
jgi:hypothetical protein